MSTYRDENILHSQAIGSLHLRCETGNDRGTLLWVLCDMILNLACEKELADSRRRPFLLKL
jgi:hypothetical protein